MTKRLKFALFGNVRQERKSAAVQKFLAIATERKAELAISEPFYLFMRDCLKIQVPECELIKDNQFAADYEVCMGGDGTFLDVASRVGTLPGTLPLTLPLTLPGTLPGPLPGPLRGPLPGPLP